MKKSILFALLCTVLYVYFIACKGGDNKQTSNEATEVNEETSSVGASKESDEVDTATSTEEIQDEEEDITSTEEEENELLSKKVFLSEQKNLPGFEKYFKYVVMSVGGVWGYDGVLYTSDDHETFIPFYEYNYRMNQGVCACFGDDKCEKVAKAKGWSYTTIPFGTMYDKNEGDIILWTDLHNEMSKLK